MGLSNQRSSCKARLKEHHRQIHLETRQQSIQKELDALAAAAKKEARKRRQQWLRTVRLADNAKRLVEANAERRGIREELQALDGRGKKDRKELKKLLQQHADVIERLEELYIYACKGFLGVETEASLSLDGNGLHPSVRVGGAAMTGVQVVAFDIAAMLLAVEGRAAIPAFLIHDSPRTTDLGISIYHKILKFGGELHSLAKEPPFQYILTTTTAPPEELRDEAVVEELSGFVDSERLLRQKI